MAAAFRSALQEAIRLRPELVLITGDVFDHPLPPTTAILTVQRGIRHLRAHLPRTQILVIAGERDTPRDPTNPGPVALLDSLPGVEAAAGAPRAVRHRNVGLHAFLLPYRASARPPAPVVRPDPSARWNVLLLRGDREGSGQPIEIDPEAWSYVAIGGSHRVTEWTSNVHTAGALERPLAGPWGEATEERGFVSFDLSSGAMEFHPVPNRPVVDLAPVRVGDGSVEVGTRRLRELLQGVPAGIEGKILRVRLRGDVVTPDEGVSQGLLDAVRRHAAHLEIQVESSQTSGLEEGGYPTWRADQVACGDGNMVSMAAQGSASLLTLLTSDSEAILLQLVGALRGVGREARSGSVEAVRVLPSPPEDPVRSALWQGGDDPDGLLHLLLPAVVGAPPPSSHDGKDGPQGSVPRDEAEDLAALESRLLERRADWVEAVGDLEAATLQWAQDRQNADSKLEVYRERARELRSRLRILETDRSEAACPTCGRAMGQHIEPLLSTLKEEWENVVQDGRWWKRRRDQLDHKPPPLQDLEEHALRRQAEVEKAAEALERLRLGGEEDGRSRRAAEEEVGSGGGSVSNRYTLPRDS
jgi:exonuclease SbcD